MLTEQEPEAQAGVPPSRLQMRRQVLSTHCALARQTPRPGTSGRQKSPVATVPGGTQIVNPS